MKLQFRIVIPNTKLKLRKVLSGLEFQIASLYQIYIFRPVPQDHSFPKQDKAELAFRLMDKDHDGTITKMEMVKKFKAACDRSRQNDDNINEVIMIKSTNIFLVGKTCKSQYMLFFHVHKERKPKTCI